MSQLRRIHNRSLWISACALISLKLFFLSVPLYTRLSQYLLPYKLLKNTFSVIQCAYGRGVTEDNQALLMLEKDWQYQKASPVLRTHSLLLWGKTLWFESISEVTTPLESADLPCSYCILYCISSREGEIFFFQTVGDNCSTEDTRKRECYNSTGSPGTEALSLSSVQELLSVCGGCGFPSPILRTILLVRAGERCVQFT